MGHAKKLCAGVVILAASALLAAPARAGSPEGLWRLEEQRYGTGAANLAPADEPVWLEIMREGAGLTARIWAGEDRSLALPWPAFVADRGPLPVEVLERHLDPVDGAVRARYRVRPALDPGDDLVLEVVEQYLVAPDGDTLTGTLTVTFHRQEETRGSYVLHRRFRRAS
jgi:hypothetical protein